MSSIFIVEYETVKTVNAKLIKIDINVIRERIPKLKDHSDEDVIEQFKNGNYRLDEDLDILLNEMYEEDKEILFGDHFDSEGESYFLSVDELDKASLEVFYHKFSDSTKEYIDSYGWHKYLDAKLPNYKFASD
jgi:hypothetical protein